MVRGSHRSTTIRGERIAVRRVEATPGVPRRRVRGPCRPSLATRKESGAHGRSAARPPRIGQYVAVAEVLTEGERRGRRRRLIVIVVVAGLILAGFLVFGRLRGRALDDKADAATTELRPAWRAIDLQGLRDAYNQATVDANNSGDFSKSIKLFPRSHDATFNSADLSTPGAVAARYSIDTWAGSECLDVVARSPVPNRVTITTHQGC